MKKKILIIEDDNILQKAIRFALKDAGFDVSQAFDGEEGSKKVKSEKPDLVLLDLMLPGMPGEQILKEMNENGLIKEIPVIVLSCKGDEANINNCLNEWQASDYFHKGNYTLEQIVGKIKEILGV